MNVYDVHGESEKVRFEDAVVAENDEQLMEILTERYGKILDVDVRYTSIEKVRVRDLSAGDLLRLSDKGINKLEVVKNKLKAMDKECDETDDCGECKYKQECFNVISSYDIEHYLKIIKELEELIK